MTMDIGADGKLTFEIKNKRPVELTDLTMSLLSVAEEYRHFIERYDPEAEAQDLRLFVKEIRTGSIITELVPYVPFALPLMSAMAQTNTVATFAKHIKSGVDFLLGRGKDASKQLDKTTYQNLSNLVEPVAKDGGSQLNIGTNYGNVYLQVDSVEANAIQNAATRAIADLREPEKGLHEKVLLRWYQARADAASQSGDRGIIESISPAAVKVICATDRIKSQMILRDENPFKEVFIVDVMVDTVNGKPALYKVLAVHDRFELDTEP